MSWRAACRSFGAARIDERRHERAAVRDRDHVDQRDVAAHGRLNQAELRVVGAFADEFGVERDRRVRRPCRDAGPQEVGVADWSFAGGRHHLIMRMPPPRPKESIMTRLPSSLAQIALLRKDPGILPASFLLSAFLALGYAGANAVLAWVDHAERILARTALDLGLTLAFFGLLLALTRRSHRFAADAERGVRHVHSAGAGDGRPAPDARAGEDELRGLAADQCGLGGRHDLVSPDRRATS